MLYLTQALFLPWLLAALALGVFVGWRSCTRTPRLEGIGWVGGLLLAFVAGLFVAALLAIPGRLGLWFDTALHFVFWYLAGCCIGCVLGRAGAADAPTSSAIAAAPAPLARATIEPAPTDRAASEPAAPREPSPTRPYQWQASKAADGVTLTGQAPSEEARLRILTQAKSTFAPLAVTDKLTIGEGAPAGLEAMAAAAFAHLAHLDRGIASLIDNRYTLTGVAETPAAHDAISAGLKAVPKGFVLARADIAAPSPQEPSLADPPPAPALPDEGNFAGQRPPGFASARVGRTDDLKRIRGIGPQNETRLHALGIWHFDQIAAWTEDQALWVGGYLAFPGRIEREGWIEQAKELAAEPPAADEPASAKRGSKRSATPVKDGGGAG